MRKSIAYIYSYRTSLCPEAFVRQVNEHDFLERVIPWGSGKVLNIGVGSGLLESTWLVLAIMQIIFPLASLLHC